jgi:transcriptional regulator with XRE-family HTH domain
MYDGQRLLREFIDQRKLPLRAVAEALHVTHPAVLQWLDGTARPSAPFREAIAKWTSGEVPTESWLEPKEATRIDDVKPCTVAPVVAPVDVDGDTLPGAP